MKALVVAFNKEKALLGAFSVIAKTDCGTDGSFYSTSPDLAPGEVPQRLGQRDAVTLLLSGLLQSLQLSAHILLAPSHSASLGF